MAQIKPDHDVIIIGGGPAGLAASFWCAEMGLTSILLEKNFECGGQLLWTYNAITNYLSIKSIDARSLRDLFLEQVLSNGGQIETNAEVVDINFASKTALLADGRTFSGKTIILATGIRRRKLGIPGESEFTGAGILKSGVTSKGEVAGKTVLIVGGGDAALENAVILSETAAEVILVHRRQSFSARKEFVDTIARITNVRVIMDAEVMSILGDVMVNAAEVREVTSKQRYLITVDKVLIRIGSEPNSELIGQTVGLNAKGFPHVLSNKLSGYDGIFVAGDLADPPAPTISSAVGNGITASAMSLRSLKGTSA
jgi:thioredoxin reductase (NADPH)